MSCGGNSPRIFGLLLWKNFVLQVSALAVNVVKDLSAGPVLFSMNHGIMDIPNIHILLGGYTRVYSDTVRNCKIYSVQEAVRGSVSTL